MKILGKNLKQGEIKVFVESPEDVWYLSQVIDKGDVIKGRTLRKIKVSETAAGERRPVFLSLVVEKIDFQPGCLRAGGKIVESPDEVPKGSFHTFSIEPGSRIVIKKDHWFSFQLDRLKEASELVHSKILICVFDREDAFFALMKRFGYELLSHIKGVVQKKAFDQNIKSAFFERIVKQLVEYDKRFGLDYIVLASPAFWKDEIVKFLKGSVLKKKVVFASCSSADESAINEVLKRDEIKTVLKEERVSKELALVENLLSEVSKGGLAVYGFENTRNAVLAGAVKTLLVSDGLINKFREEGVFSKLESLMKSVEKMKGKVFLVSSEHSGGKKLDGLGGVAGLLRFKLSCE
ncbi:mRNA surveillance protein pelota [Candidatus Woesearchaeota archaeon]|nr:MAG: mRNA surveillance protein pelota [Candidatus Woesearchaeota archaeon]